MDDCLVCRLQPAYQTFIHTGMSKIKININNYVNDIKLLVIINHVFALMT